jgi:UDP-N-acetylmuramate dehydrogenase
MTAAECGFGYRTSVFKRSAQASAGQAGARPTGRYVVLSVTFRLGRGGLSAPVTYAELAARLGVAEGGRAPLAKVREAVLELRRGKGMVLDPADPDSRSAGSFFTNPVLSPDGYGELLRRAGLPEGAVPRFPAGPDAVKVPAAWLIERAGFARGYPGHGVVRISAKHTLALTTRPGATAAALIGLAREIATGVKARFGVELTPEPVLVGVEL